MKGKRAESIELPAVKESFGELQAYFQENLDAEAISKELVMETMLVIEALFHNILEQTDGSRTTLRLSFRESLGNVVIGIGFEGKMAYLFTEEDGDISPDNRVLRAYEEKIESSYRFGYNSFKITVKRKHSLTLLYCAAGILFAFLAFLPLHFLLPTDQAVRFGKEILVPLEELFGNAAFMISAPVTFFSLLKNLTHAYILSERYSIVRKLRFKAMATSVITILLATGLAFLFLRAYRMLGVAKMTMAAEPAMDVISRWISEAMPSSIFVPFEAAMPVPLIVISLLLTYVFCSSGRYFGRLKQAVDACYTVFSKMLGLVLFALPFFFFVTVLQLLIFTDYDTLLHTTLIILMMLGSILFVVAFYLIRLKIGGVRLVPFLKKIPPLLLENIRINSCIDAVPFNIRYCARNLGIDRKRLEMKLPILAQVMYDGNGFLLMSIAMFLAFSTGRAVTWYGVLMSGILVFFLSLGAPNQPGGLLVGTMIMIQYFGVDLSSAIYLAIAFEAALGVFQNLFNVAGDIVTVTIEEERIRKAAAASAGGGPR